MTSLELRSDRDAAPASSVPGWAVRPVHLLLAGVLLLVALSGGLLLGRGMTPESCTCG